MATAVARSLLLLTVAGLVRGQGGLLDDILPPPPLQPQRSILPQRNNQPIQQAPMQMFVSPQQVPSQQPSQNFFSPSDNFVFAQPQQQPNSLTFHTAPFANSNNNGVSRADLQPFSEFGDDFPSFLTSGGFSVASRNGNFPPTSFPQQQQQQLPQQFPPQRQQPAVVMRQQRPAQSFKNALPFPVQVVTPEQNFNQNNRIRLPPPQHFSNSNSPVRRPSIPPVVAPSNSEDENASGPNDSAFDAPANEEHSNPMDAISSAKGFPGLIPSTRTVTATLSVPVTVTQFKTRTRTSRFTQLFTTTQTDVTTDTITSTDMSTVLQFHEITTTVTETTRQSVEITRPTTSFVTAPPTTITVTEPRLTETITTTFAMETTVGQLSPLTITETVHSTPETVSTTVSTVVAPASTVFITIAEPVSTETTTKTFTTEITSKLLPITITKTVPGTPETVTIVSTVVIRPSAVSTNTVISTVTSTILSPPITVSVPLSVTTVTITHTLPPPLLSMNRRPPPNGWTPGNDMRPPMPVGMNGGWPRGGPLLFGRDGTVPVDSETAEDQGSSVGEPVATNSAKASFMEKGLQSARTEETETTTLAAPEGAASDVHGAQLMLQTTTEDFGGETTTGAETTTVTSEGDVKADAAITV